MGSALRVFESLETHHCLTSLGEFGSVSLWCSWNLDICNNSTGSLQSLRVLCCKGSAKALQKAVRAMWWTKMPDLPTILCSCALPLGLCIFLIEVYRRWLLSIRDCCRWLQWLWVFLLPALWLCQIPSLMTESGKGTFQQTELFC